MVAVGTTICCFSKSLPDDPRTFPVLIMHEKGMGSGCVLQLSNSVYLVTAKHVLFGKPEGTNPPILLSATAAVRAYSQVGTTNVSERTFFLNLSQLMRDGEISYSSNRDVTVVRIEECLTNNHDVVKILPGVGIPPGPTGLVTRGAAFVCAMADIEVGAEVYMFGYPTSLTGPISQIFEPWEPLLRRGIVAGVNLDKRTIIIDCPSYQGNSGGPVVQVDHPSWGVTRFRIIGLVTGFVPFQEEWENKTLQYSHVLKSNSGYTVIEPIDIAMELVCK